MEYNSNLWNEYTNDNLKSEQKILSDFIYYTAIGLGAKKICEAGCNVGNNLSSFPSTYEIYGIDMNEYALDKAKARYPNFHFKKEDLKNTSFPDSFFDLVFTRGVLIHIPSNYLDDVLKEILRISKRWIFNLEYFGNDGEMIKWKRGDDLLWYRDMKKRWKKFDVEIISNTEMPTEIDIGKNRFTLIRKNTI